MFNEKICELKSNQYNLIICHSKSYHTLVTPSTWYAVVFFCVHSTIKMMSVLCCTIILRLQNKTATWLFSFSRIEPCQFTTFTFVVIFISFDLRKNAAMIKLIIFWNENSSCATCSRFPAFNWSKISLFETFWAI